MPMSLSNYTDEQLKHFLHRARTRHLLPLLNVLSTTDVERIMGLLSPVSAAFIRRALQEASSDPSLEAQQLLEEIVFNSGSCIFCRIFSGELPVSYVYTDDRIAVLMDLYPVTPGHMLVVPQRHVESLTDLDYDVAAAMMTKAQELGRAAMKSELGPDGFNLFLANGGAAGQDVFHVHLHVLPRYYGDGFGMVFPPGYPREADRTDLDRNAEMIKAAM